MPDPAPGQAPAEQPSAPASREAVIATTQAELGKLDQKMTEEIIAGALKYELDFPGYVSKQNNAEALQKAPLFGQLLKNMSEFLKGEINKIPDAQREAWVSSAAKSTTMALWGRDVGVFELTEQDITDILTKLKKVHSADQWLEINQKKPDATAESKQKLDALKTRLAEPAFVFDEVQAPGLAAWKKEILADLDKPHTPEEVAVLTTDVEIFTALIKLFKDTSELETTLTTIQEAQIDVTSEMAAVAALKKEIDEYQGNNPTELDPKYQELKAKTDEKKQDVEYASIPDKSYIGEAEALAKKAGGASWFQEIVVDLKGIIASLATMPLIGAFFRGKVISIREIAKHDKDTKAGLDRCQERMIKFGLAPALAVRIADMTIADAKAMLGEHPENFGEASAVNQLISQLDRCSEDKTKTFVFDYLSSAGVIFDYKPKAPAPSAPLVASATPSATAPAPAAPATTPPATPAASKAD